MEDSRNSPKLFWIVLAIPLFIAASVSILFLWGWGAFDPPDVVSVEFEAAKWRLAEPIEDHRTVRSQMIDDLIRRRLLDGLYRIEVERLLGPPLPDIKQAGVDVSRWHAAYHVGMERNGRFSLDDEMLVIRFDESGRVAEYGTAVN